tara:strand:- start:239 stop:574 length:336 start_codon:yes stop_codon:yes gene_type:complete
MTETTSLLTVVASIVMALTSTAAWEFWKKKLSTDKQLKDEEQKETHLYRDDLREEVKGLRKKLGDLYSSREKELKALREQISDLREELATFKTRVTFLERENQELREALDN